MLAGGQSLMPVLKLRLAAPTLLVDLGRIDEPAGHQRRRRRDRHRRDDDARRGGEQRRSSREHAAVLSKAAQTVADPQVRHRGTLGGALVHADPAGDLPAPILALDAELVIAGAGGERTVAAADFFEDLFTTVVGEDEILTADPDPQAHRLGRALREVHPGRAAVVDRRGRGARRRPRAARSPRRRSALTNMGSTPLRASAVEAGAGRAAADRRGGQGGAARRRRRAPTRRPTPTATRTTVVTWRPCSPAGPFSPQRRS